MREFLIRIKVIQHKITDKDNVFKRRNLYRMNPYNPLSYISLFFIIIIGLIMFGVVGFNKEVDIKTPFSWR